MFEPTPEAIRNADLADERVKDAKDHAMTSSAHPTATAMDIMELTDSEDDELPGFEELLQQSSSQKSQKSDSQKTVKRLESMKLEDDGFEMTGSSTSTGLSPPSPPHPGLTDASFEGPKGKSEQKTKDEGKEELDPRLVEIWKQANIDLEPSTKMVALLKLLKSWDASGDKTICFSQCRSESHIRVKQLTKT